MIDALLSADHAVNSCGEGRAPEQRSVTARYFAVDDSGARNRGFWHALVDALGANRRHLLPDVLAIPRLQASRQL